MDYEKKYKEVLERLKGLIEGTREDKCAIVEEDIIDIFPELAESEDEKIRKAIKYCIMQGFIGCGKIENVTPDECLAWLEKQVDKDKLIKELGKYKVKYTQDVLSQQLEKQDAYSSNVGKYFIAPEESLGTSSDKNNEVVNDCIFGEQGEKKWTEEDEKRLQSCISSLQGKGLMGGVDTINTKWLKSLKQRMEGKL